MDKEYRDLIMEVLEQFDGENGGGFLMTGSPVNPMAVGWIQVGTIWEKRVLSILVRTSRHSFPALMKDGRFTISVPAKGTLEKELVWCGTYSGRDHDKMAELGLSTVPSRTGGVPGVKGCAIQIECRTLYTTEVMEPERIDESVKEFYDAAKQAGDKGDPHIIFVAEIVDIYRA